MRRHPSVGWSQTYTLRIPADSYQYRAQASGALVAPVIPAWRLCGRPEATAMIQCSPDPVTPALRRDAATLEDVPQRYEE